MINQNDNKILQLKKQIEIKKTKIKKGDRFTPITNCSLELDGQHFNLNALNKQQLQILAIKIKMYINTIKELEFDNILISGYTCDEWLKDIFSKLSVVFNREEEQNLRHMESKLDELLSNEKRVELELGSIEDMLK